MNTLAKAYTEALLDKNRQKAQQIIMKALSNGVSIKEVYLNIFQEAQWEIGRLWQNNKISVAMEHYCTAATQLIMSRLYEQVFTEHNNGFSLVAISVSGELHELGIRMVTDFFEMDGWDTYYLGANTPVEGIIEMVKETGAHILAISATIYFNIPQVKEVIQAIRSAHQTQCKIMVGGGVFNTYDNLWQDLEADSFARDAQGAISAARKLVGI